MIELRGIELRWAFETLVDNTKGRLPWRHDTVRKGRSFEKRTHASSPPLHLFFSGWSQSGERSSCEVENVIDLSFCPSWCGCCGESFVVLSTLYISHEASFSRLSWHLQVRDSSFDDNRTDLVERLHLNYWDDEISHYFSPALFTIEIYDVLNFLSIFPSSDFAISE